MRISIVAAVSENGVIGNGLKIPWQADGEQLLFKALTYGQWLLVGRRTYKTIAHLKKRKFVVLSKSSKMSQTKNLLQFTSVDDALQKMEEITDQLFVVGGGSLYRQMIDKADFLHISTIHRRVDGDVFFPKIPKIFKTIFCSKFTSNIDYTYRIWESRLAR